MKKAIIYEIYNNSHLPKKGWLQFCCICDTITSNTKFYSQLEDNNKLYEFHTYVCPYCKKELKHSLKKRIHYYRIIQKKIRKIIDR